MIRTDKLTDKGHGYKVAISDGISDLTLMAIATDYRTSVSRRYRTLPARNLSTLATVEKVVCSIKYDGEGVFAYTEPEKDVLFFFNAPSGRVRLGLPCQDALLAKLKAAGVKRALFVGELYLKNVPGKPHTQVGDVIHATFKGSQEEVKRLSFAAYDIIMLNGKDLRAQQSAFNTTWDKLGEIFGTDQAASSHRVEGRVLAGKDLTEEFKTITAKRGEEGIVVRTLTTPDIYKIKPSLTIDGIVLGYVEGDYEGQYGVTSILTGLIDPKSGKVVAFFRVGSGFNDEQRRQLLEPLGRLKVSSPIDMTDSDGRPISFTSPSMIIEIEGEALQKETHSGKPSISQVFTWDGKAYTFSGLQPCPLFTHATFVRIREDKTWQDGGARLEQVFTEGEIKTLIAGSSALPAGHSQIVHRQVWTKILKGETLVHKLVVVSSADANRFPYTLVYTDYSKGRAEPLKKKVLVANSLERAHTLLADYQAEASGKGWKEEAGSISLPPLSAAT